MSTLHLPGSTHVYSGKVRDLYIPVSDENLDSASQVLMVASDRVSAFDHLLEPPIPGKGAVLTALTLWWFRQMPQVPNHLLSTDVPDAVAGRAIVAKKLKMYPIECVVRGYITGSGWKEYLATGTVCGVPLPEGLERGDRLPEPIFTPAFKAPQGEHDRNISFQEMTEIVGETAAERLRDTSLEVYRIGAQIALDRGLILADTKFEFGDDLGRLVLADEVLTPDSSRYWDHAEWLAGEREKSFDKQIVRDWLTAHWDQSGTPPELPAEIVEKTAAKYHELEERLTRSDG
ncbi:MAG TPA: phosphoribosylaminoimidazolesuccinocarboxamide synthase [Pseudoclavibacter sp.]|nr:phosphoribosylaminoimidazolesuccinocarboxamide synthase [Pseudoclavibacter sp.]